MKQKDITKGEELERINNELFGSFDPEDESGIGGGSTKTITDMYTFTPTGTDMNLDIEWDFSQIEGISS
jgi:hypothetical protein